MTDRYPLLPHFSSFLHQNLAKTCEEAGKRRFQTAFAVCSSQTLVKIYNSYCFIKCFCTPTVVLLLPCVVKVSQNNYTWILVTCRTRCLALNKFALFSTWQNPGTDINLAVIVRVAIWQIYQKIRLPLKNLLLDYLTSLSVG